MRVLIVGAGGCLGRQLADQLAAREHEVVCFDLKRVEGTPHLWVLGDIRVPHQLDEAAEGCQTLVHIPAWHGIHLRYKTRREFWELNVDGAFNAFQAAMAAGVRKVLYCSAMGVYGGIPRPPDRALCIDDDSPRMPAKDVYAYTKVVGEELCELYHRIYGLDALAFRLGMFVPVDYVHYGMRLAHGGVDERDLAQAFRLALENDAVHDGVFNLFAPTPFQDEDAEALIQDPMAVLRKHYPDADVLDTAARDRQLDPHWYTVGGDAIRPTPIPVYWRSDRARELLGWHPEHDFAAFLREMKDGMAEHVRANRYPVPNAPPQWRP